MLTVPESEISSRLASFKACLAARGVSGALITTRADRFYLCGTVQDGLLWVDTVGAPVFWVLRDPVRARRETPVNVETVGSRRDLWARARAKVGRGPVGLPADVFAVSDLPRLGLELSMVEDVSSDLLGLRSRKSPWEVERMEETGRVAARVYAYAAEILRPGLTEAELAGLLFARAMALGHEGLLRTRGDFEAYSWHVLSGPNTAVPGANDSPMSGEGFSPSFPVGAGRRQIQRGEPVLVDFGICVFGYQTDQTRTFCLGPPPAWLREAHHVLEDVYARVTAALVPGVRAGDVFAAGEKRAQELGLEGYLGAAGSKSRFVGHGIGIQTVEPPIVAAGSAERIEAGTTLAVEPKAVVDGLGGFGVEDTLLITGEGARPLAPIPPGLLLV